MIQENSIQTNWKVVSMGGCVVQWMHGWTDIAFGDYLVSGRFGYLDVSVPRKQMGGHAQLG
jgi:hypothetical protein